MKMMRFLVFIPLLALQASASAFDWHQEKNLFWAERCDWNGNNLSNMKSTGAECGGKCASTSGCTHFTWTGYQGGTCWLKKNSVSQSQATPANEYSVCGYLKSQSGGPPPPPPPGPSGKNPQVRTVNNCKYPVWVGAFGTQFTPANGGWKLNPGESKTVDIPVSGEWNGRFWGRTDCDGNGRCATGQCAGIECKGTTGQPPASLAEITFNGAGGQDFYDVSLVDGYNIPIKLRPIPGTYTGSCQEIGCTSDLNAICPSELAVKVKGRVVACKSACEAFNQPKYCCTGAFGTQPTCPPTNYSKIFKKACPKAYSYAYDDASSLFQCRGANGVKGASYEVQFC